MLSYKCVLNHQAHQNASAKFIEMPTRHSFIIIVISSVAGDAFLSTVKSKSVINTPWVLSIVKLDTLVILKSFKLKVKVLIYLLKILDVVCDRDIIYYYIKFSFFK